MALLNYFVANMIQKQNQGFPPIISKPIQWCVQRNDDLIKHVVRTRRCGNRSCVGLPDPFLYSVFVVGKILYLHISVYFFFIKGKYSPCVKTATWFHQRFCHFRSTERTVVVFGKTYTVKFRFPFTFDTILQ